MREFWRLAKDVIRQSWRYFVPAVLVAIILSIVINDVWLDLPHWWQRVLVAGTLGGIAGYVAAGEAHRAERREWYREYQARRDAHRKAP
jgi:hypothetical protein